VRWPPFGLRCFHAKPGQRDSASSRSRRQNEIAARETIAILFISFHEFDPNLRF
jgi:hypothetical protein